MPQLSNRSIVQHIENVNAPGEEDTCHEHDVTSE